MSPPLLAAGDLIFRNSPGIGSELSGACGFDIAPDLDLKRKDSTSTDSKSSLAETVCDDDGFAFVIRRAFLRFQLKGSGSRCGSARGCGSMGSCGSMGGCSTEGWGGGCTSMVGVDPMLGCVFD